MILGLAVLALSLQVQATNESGQHLFTARCAGCHGLDGRGGEHAPNIATSAAVQALSNADLIGIVHDGIASRGMPAFASALSSAQINSVVDYLRDLSGSGSKVLAPGDPAAGEKLFFGSAGCSQCHAVQSRGGHFGGDLTTYAATHSGEALRNAILDPAKVLGPIQGSIEITTTSGSRLSGMIRNQDNFSVQLQTPDGAFHFLDRSELASAKAAPVPGHMDSKLSRSALDEISSYLSATSKQVRPPRQEF